MQSLFILISVLSWSLLSSLPVRAMDLNDVFKHKQAQPAQKYHTSKIYDKEGRYLRSAHQGYVPRIYNDANGYQGSARMPQK